MGSHGVIHWLPFPVLVFPRSLGLLGTSTLNHMGITDWNHYLLDLEHDDHLSVKNVGDVLRWDLTSYEILMSCIAVFLLIRSGSSFRSSRGFLVCVVFPIWLILFCCDRQRVCL
jgi:hypothetical protein